MKKITLNLGILALLIMIVLPILPVFGAEGDYTVLAPLPGTTECDKDITKGGCQTTLEKYLPGLFNLMIGIAGVFAVLMIVIGGFQYMSTDALQGKEDGKTRIWNSVKGLVLVISAWLILDTVNPALLKLNLNIEKITIAPPAGGGGTLGGGGSAPWVRLTEAQIATSNEIRGSLKRQGVPTYEDPCTKTGVSTGCVNLNGLQTQTQAKVLALKGLCGTGCTTIITGGTEGGHSGGSSHNTGNALDLRFNPTMDAYIIRNGGIPTQVRVGQNLYPKYTVNLGGRITTFLKEDDHWHME